MGYVVGGSYFVNQVTTYDVMYPISKVRGAFQVFYTTCLHQTRVDFQVLILIFLKYSIRTSLKFSNRQGLHIHLSSNASDTTDMAQNPQNFPRPARNPQDD